MTFNQIKTKETTYINKFGLVFTPLLKTGYIIVSYNLDGTTKLEIIKLADKLTTIFRHPDKVNYTSLYKLKVKNTTGCTMI